MSEDTFLIGHRLDPGRVAAEFRDGLAAIAAQGRGPTTVRMVQLQAPFWLHGDGAELRAEVEHTLLRALLRDPVGLRVRRLMLYDPPSDAALPPDVTHERLGATCSAWHEQVARTMTTLGLRGQQPRRRPPDLDVRVVILPRASAATRGDVERALPRVGLVIGHDDPRVVSFERTWRDAARNYTRPSRSDYLPAADLHPSVAG